MALNKKSDKNKSNNKEQKAERKPLVINYDKDGNRIGDDGFVMTATRTRMHRLCDIMLVWGIIAAVIAVLCCIFAYAQGAEFTSWELKTTGGNLLNGFEMNYLLRAEALFVLFTCLTSSLLSFWGFRWFYDNEASPRFMVGLYVMLAVSCIWLGMAVIIVHVAEPASIINILLMIVTLTTANAVKAERPTLRKAKVAKSVVKK